MLKNIWVWLAMAVMVGVFMRALLNHIIKTELPNQEEDSKQKNSKGPAE